MKIRKELITRQIAGETILVPVGSSVYESNGLFALNELGGFLWQHIPAVETPQELVQLVLSEYDIDAATAAADVEEFLQTLREMKILE